MHIKIGTRKSKLALVQAQEVARQIEHLGHTCEIITILTTGDKIKDKNLYDIGGKALFLKEIEDALLQDQIDMAVHSFKDVPAYIPHQLQVAAVLERKSVLDVLISTHAPSIGALPKNARVGTSSVRRKAQILNMRPDLQILDCRGNVTLRIEKFLQGQYDAIVLAACGLERIDMFDSSYCHLIPEEEILPAVAQGIIAVEIQKDNYEMLDISKKINHIPTWDLVKAERGFLEGMNADCKTPLAALAQKTGSSIFAKFLLASIDPLKFYYHEEKFHIEDGYDVGFKASKLLLDQKHFGNLLHK